MSHFSTSINGLAGDVVLSAGTNIDISQVGAGIVISATGGGGGLSGGYGEWDTGTSRGSTNTNIFRFTNTILNNDGGHWTFTDSSTNGSYWTINNTGVYSFSVSVNISSASIAIKRATSLNNNFAAENTDLMGIIDSGGNAHLSTIMYCASNDIVWVATNSGGIGNYPEINRIHVIRIR